MNRELILERDSNCFCDGNEKHIHYKPIGVKMDPLIIYHNNCYDGVTAAWVCYSKYGQNAEYKALNYSDPVPNVIDRDVVIVDFSFKREIMQNIIEHCRSLIVLDHHKTAEQELKDLPIPKGKKVEIIFDMNRSGAGIAWDYFYDTPRHTLVNYAEDRDLWRFQIYRSKEVNAFIQSFPIDLQAWWSTLVPFFNNHGIEEIANIGSHLLRQQDKLVRSIAANARMKPLPPTTDGMKPDGIYVQTNILMSEVCDQMLKDHPEAKFAFYSFERKDGKIQYGLRSRSDFDVSVLAKMYGGGGHKQAAGFEL